MLYHRLRQRELLSQATRARIYEAIRAEPGIRTGTLAVSLGLDYKTVAHHVRLLSVHGLLRAAGGEQPRHYVPGAAPRPEVVAALATPTTRSVHDFLARHGETPLVEVACALGLGKSTVSEAASHLRRVGLVAKRRIGRRMYLRPAGVPPAAILTAATAGGP